MTHELQQQNIARVTRRQLFGSAASGIGVAALASLLKTDTATGSTTQESGQGLPELPHFAPKAKRVIVFWQGGGPSHVDLFDEKSMLKQMSGQDVPDSGHCGWVGGDGSGEQSDLRTTQYLRGAIRCRYCVERLPLRSVSPGNQR